MSAQSNYTPRFVRKTQLATNEYHKNFEKIDREVIAAVSSVEADKVTPLMSKIYLRLVNAPAECWEREGVLRFEAESREGVGRVKAWDALCDTLGVASATANKALTWMHAQGIIGYFSGKNGVGIRIFLNRALSSIGVRAPAAGQKILHFAAASSREAHASPNEAASNDSFAMREISDLDLKPHAPKNGADAKPVNENPPRVTPATDRQPWSANLREGRESDGESNAAPHQSARISVNEIVERLRSELEPCVRSAAAAAAARASAIEAARTREWFETKALPKAVRVAQSESYNLLRKHGAIEERAQRARAAALDVGRTSDDSNRPDAARPLTVNEITEVAETCIALLETQGKKVDATLAEISAESGGWVLPEDVARVSDEAQRLLRAKSERG